MWKDWVGVGLCDMTRGVSAQIENGRSLEWFEGSRLQAGVSWGTIGIANTSNEVYSPGEYTVFFWWRLCYTVYQLLSGENPLRESQRSLEESGGQPTSTRG